VILILRIRSSAVYPLIFGSLWSIEATILNARLFLEVFTDPVSVVSVAETRATSTLEHILHLTLDIAAITIANITIIALLSWGKKLS
jgi:hypothetical protein